MLSDMCVLEYIAKELNLWCTEFAIENYTSDKMSI